MFKRLVISVCVSSIVGAIALSTYGVDPSKELQVESRTMTIASYLPRFNRAKPVIAIVAKNRFTELTDYVVPYAVLTESGVAQVVALATKEGAIQMFPSLRVQPQATVAEFDVHFPEGADYVVVPAVHHIEDQALIAWVAEQAKKGATIVGVCDGVWVVANAGLLSGRKAVGHWYSFDDLKKKFPKSVWVQDMRYLADGRVVTTTGVTASSLACPLNIYSYKMSTS